MNILLDVDISGQILTIFSASYLQHDFAHPQKYSSSVFGVSLRLRKTESKIWIPQHLYKYTFINLLIAVRSSPIKKRIKSF